MIGPLHPMAAPARDIAPAGPTIPAGLVEAELSEVSRPIPHDDGRSAGLTALPFTGAFRAPTTPAGLAEAELRKASRSMPRPTEEVAR